MACDGSSEKDIRVKQKTIVKIHLLCRFIYCLQYVRLYVRLEKVKIVLMLKQLRNEINKTNGTSFDDGYISQLLDKKIITNVKTSQHLDSFRLSTTEITSKNNLPLQVEEIVLDDTEQCQHSLHKKFVR